MIYIQRIFYVLSGVMAICCCMGLLYIIDDDITGVASNYYPQRHNLDEICESSTSYDYLSVIPEYTRPIAKNTEWVCNLYREVKQIKVRRVTLLVCNESYLHILINWLAYSVVSAFHPVNSILVIAFDSFTYRVLRYKGFHSVHISPEAVANSRTNKSKAHIWITRLTVARLLNHWNHSVLMFDSDAIMLRNILPLLSKFSGSDIIASAGIFPKDLKKKWNVPTICMGVILIKCSAATEYFWLRMRTAVHSDLHRIVDDQIGANNALDDMGVTWRQTNHKYYKGSTSGNVSLTITTIPQSVICRYLCNKKLLTHYYVWHKYAKDRKNGESKKAKLSEDNLWILQDNWNKSLWDTSLISKQWLLNITKPNEQQ